MKNNMKEIIKLIARVHSQAAKLALGEVKTGVNNNAMLPETQNNVKVEERRTQWQNM